MKNGKYAVDRIEGDVAVLISDDDGSYLHLPNDTHRLSVNDLVYLEFDDGSLISLKKLDGEKEDRLEKNKSRLQALFAKGRKK